MTLAWGRTSLVKLAGALLATCLMGATLMAQTAAATRYDEPIQTTVTHKLASKSQLSDVKATMEDGIVTLTGTVDLYQRKLDAGKAGAQDCERAGRAQPDHGGRR